MEEKETTPVETPAVNPKPVTTPEPMAAPAPSTQGWPDQPAPQPTQIQYVVAQKSLNGIEGMLILWIIIFALTGIGYISTFIMTATNSSVNGTGLGITAMIFSPFIIAAALFAVVMIAMRKKLAVWASIGAAGIMLLSSIVSTIVGAATVNSVVSQTTDLYGGSAYMTAAANTASSAVTAAAIASILTSLVYGGLVALYFLTSKRVKQTLVK